MSFQLAARRNSKLRLALSGTAGSGKTYTALQIARMFSANIGLADSERKASEKYAIKAGKPEAPGAWRFQVSTDFEKSPDGYVKLIADAAEARFDVLILDSYSHMWIGARDEVDRSSGASKFTSGWKAVSPKVSKVVDRILDFPGHIIATLRSKAEYALEKDEKTGKIQPRKIGMETVARDGTDYEFDVMLDLTPEGTLTVTKTRFGESLPMGKTFERSEIPEIVRLLKAELDAGVPLTALEIVLEDIRRATTLEALQGLKGKILALSPEDRAVAKDPYAAKKAELSKELADAADLEGIS
jgi:hypothetical protein